VLDQLFRDGVPRAQQRPRIADSDDGVGRVSKRACNDDLVQAVPLLGEAPLRPRQHVGRRRGVGVEFRNVGLPLHRRVQTVGQRREHAVEQIAACDSEELVAVEREDKVGAVARKRVAHGRVMISDCR
jgi:hypothetical protein